MCPRSVDQTISNRSHNLEQSRSVSVNFGCKFRAKDFEIFSPPQVSHKHSARETKARKVDGNNSFRTGRIVLSAVAGVENGKVFVGGAKHIGSPGNQVVGAEQLAIVLAVLIYRQNLIIGRSEEHTSELQSPCNLVCRLLLEKK